MQQRDTLTSLDARNSLLLERSKTTASDISESFSIIKTGATVDTKEVSDARPLSSAAQRYSGPQPEKQQPTANPMFSHTRGSSGDSLRNITPNNPYAQQPRLPSLGGDVYANYAAGGYGRGPSPLPLYNQGGYDGNYGYRR